MLSDGEIRDAMAAGEIVITPEVADKDIQPASIDVHLGTHFIVYGREAEITHLMPRQFILAEIAEHVTLGRSIAARIEGKSSLGRLGLGVHITAGFVDPCWSGILTMELYNFSDDPIPLTPGMYIAQLAFERLGKPVLRGYGEKELGSKYQGDTQVSGSRGGG